MNREADQRFRELAIEHGLHPGNRWVGGSVAHVWERSRHIFEHIGVPLDGARLLEFGCGVGGTAVALAIMGARVTAVEVDSGLTLLAAANAERYGVKNIDFHCLPDTTHLPFGDEEFDVAVCYSVLEYVPHAVRRGVQGEIDRTLRKGGVIVVGGTSNRLWPREIHSGRWFTNYRPRAFDEMLFWRPAPQRGVWPWEVSRQFGRYINVDLAERGWSYLAARRARGMPSARYLALRLAIPALWVFGVWVGLLTPSISVTLRKR